MGRIGSVIYGGATDKEAALRKAILAQSMLLLLRGGPVIYYGDEKGMAGSGGDKLARQDMFPTQVESWKWEARIGSDPIGEGNSFDSTNPIANEIKALQKIIVNNPALRSGTQQTLFAQGQVYVASRYADKQEYLVAFNAADESKTVSVKPITSQGSWDTLAGNCTSNEKVEVALSPNSFCLLKATTLITKSSTSKVSNLKFSSSNDSPLWKQLSVTVNSPGYNSVTFLAREPKGKWKSLGTADRTTFETNVTPGNLYRVFLQPEQFRKNAKLEFIAILKNSDGKILTSKVATGVNK
jgi:hypothetical protein